MRRMLQLDGIRGIAVSFVVLHHWTQFGRAMDLGNLGVQLFFVLSGFLITAILLDLRADHEAGTAGFGSVMAKFWQGRASRIWPVCFLTLAAVYLAGDRFERREDMAWHFLFASNLLFFHRGVFDSSLSHFWTLAVEQQFYLVWPFVILFVRRVHLEAAIVAMVLVAPLSRIFLYAIGYQDFTGYNLLPFASLDSLGLGALVAWWSRMPEREAATRWRALYCLAAVGALAFLLNRLRGPLPANMEQTFYALVFAAIVAAGSKGIPGFVGRLLTSRPLVALGVISYGVYVYHMFAPRLVGAGLRAIDAPQALQSGMPLFVLSAALTITAASLSWFLMESPINKARRNWHQRSAVAPTLRESGV